MDGRRCRYVAEFLAFRSLVCLVQMMSPRLCREVADGLAFVVHRLLPRKMTRYHVARENIRQAFGDRYSEAQIDRLIYNMWRHLFRMVAEIVQLPRKLRLSNVVDAIEFRSKHEVVAALCSGRPVMLVSGHFGNWEMAISIFGLFGFRMALVARELDNPYLERWFLRFRKYTGHRPIPKKGGGALMTEMLQRRGHLALLGDQDAGAHGVFVNFFGRPASTHKSIALLALEYDALICVGYARRLSDSLPNGWPRYEVGCEQVIDTRDFADDPAAVTTLTQQYSVALEHVVRRAPEQYFWVHRRWKSEPRARTRKAKAAAAAVVCEPERLAG